MPDRIPCCIPFCRRTAAAAKHPGAEEIICGACGSRVRPERRAFRRAQRAAHAAWNAAETSPGVIDARPYQRAAARTARLWSAFKRRAAAAKLRALAAGTGERRA